VSGSHAVMRRGVLSVHVKQCNTAKNTHIKQKLGTKTFVYFSPNLSITTITVTQNDSWLAAAKWFHNQQTLKQSWTHCWSNAKILYHC